jgi:RNA polymerase sigma-70 factor (ECF subfamily)
MEFTDDEVAHLYDRYGHVLYHRCRSILRNDEDARDAVQETFARVLRHADSFREQASPLTWMYRISTNHCLNRIRDRRGQQRKHEHNREDIVGPGVTVARDGEEAADRDRILALLDDADQETKACVVHTFFDDCTREEVAELVGLSVPTVRKRINTFLDTARRQLGLSLARAVGVLWFVLSWSPP